MCHRTKGNKNALGEDAGQSNLFLACMAHKKTTRKYTIQKINDVS